MTRKFAAPVAVQNPPPVDLSESTASVGGTQYESESCLLVSSTKVAEACRSFMVHHYSLQEGHRKWDHLPVRIVHFHILGAEERPASAGAAPQTRPSSSSGDASSTGREEAETQKHQMCVHVVLFPASAFPLAKSFWQHTGDGISSRRAESCLRLLAAAHKDDITHAAPTSVEPARTASGDGSGSGGASTPVEAAATTTAAPARAYGRNRHYARAGSSSLQGAASSSPASSTLLSRTNSAAAGLAPTATHAGTSGVTTINAELSEDVPLGDQLSYVEERYGRNLPAGAAIMAKAALKKRIAATLLCDQLTAGNATTGPCAEDRIQESTGPTVRQGTSLTEDDVFLFPTGMSAIWHAHQIAIAEKRRTEGEAAVGKSVCFGFPYIDTLKILQKWGPGCHFFGHGDAGDLDKLRALLEGQATSGEPRILALFCEFPSNPLLRAPDMPALRALADEHGFLIVVDETIGNFLNVEVLPYADMVVSSLTKIFSGDSNVMGGSLVLNPKGPRAASLRETLRDEYEDLYFAEDALFMERNSRAFVSRSNKINENALALVEMLVAEVGRGVVKDVFYPSLPSSRVNYDKCRRKEALLPRSAGGAPATTQEGGFGGLFSVTFTTLEASKAFYDALSCAKGPSLGSTFTLSCPYTLIAHYTELDWAESLGVDRGLVRISTGVEDLDTLMGMMAVALMAAGRAARRR